MKAAICTKHGSPDFLQIKEIPGPVPKNNEILVKIHATTVTSGDVALRRLTFFQFILIWPIARLLFGVKNLRKSVLGHEFAGEIVETGNNANLFKKGDPVFGTTGFAGGAHAEYICLKEDGIIAPKPDNISFEEAAALPIGGICSLYLLKKSKISSGQKVLIYGASGSIGTYSVQLAKYFGAEVTGVSSSANVDLVKSLGADKIFDYTREEFENDMEKYDVVFDTVGKLNSTQKKKFLKKGGNFISTHGSSVKELKEDLAFIKKLAEEGKIKAVVDKVYPFEAIADTHRHVDTKRKKGNVVVTVKNN